KRRKNII
ncbi:Chromosomal replication initiator protein DnaA, partial [Haemophilus influenzae]